MEFTVTLEPLPLLLPPQLKTAVICAALSMEIDLNGLVLPVSDQWSKVHEP
jgi:hypothetical protein